jgi:hypothetical protein
MDSQPHLLPFNFESIILKVVDTYQVGISVFAFPATLTTVPKSIFGRISKNTVNAQKAHSTMIT